MQSTEGSFPRNPKIIPERTLTQRCKKVARDFRTLQHLWRCHNFSTNLWQRCCNITLTFPQRCQVWSEERSFQTNRQHRYNIEPDAETTLWQRLCVCWVWPLLFYVHFLLETQPSWPLSLKQNLLVLIKK